MPNVRRIQIEAECPAWRIVAYGVEVLRDLIAYVDAAGIAKECDPRNMGQACCRNGLQGNRNVPRILDRKASGSGAQIVE